MAAQMASARDEPVKVEGTDDRGNDGIKHQRNQQHKEKATIRTHDWHQRQDNTGHRKRIELAEFRKALNFLIGRPLP